MTAPLDTSEIRKRRQAWMARAKFTDAELPHVDVASACFLAVVDVPALCDALDAARAALRDLVRVAEETTLHTPCRVEDNWCSEHEDDAEDGVCSWGRDAAVIERAKALQGGA